ncbi:Pyridine nucleotide-disulfide oxidoreductase, FAD/NAD(P)-binding domain containing protein [Desulfovibrio sp. X2]|uniref:NAD(P)/FAD-dependent oxidoreductase n=1 Tax=Desulfovibrio sp. X2 TaxID=941449 RepID=UPI000358C272|nr:NAD(P)/FAD-dependent oxidoreductase [Desulfovibrio sp. X2]EPR37596.1 Pyridine nucleotide-disulfide oxidoreductase, FAD/NAD(P)-binding domain containing protein [Desulfovibrio sp. X2]
MQQETSRPRVVILGAGFAGLWAARALAGKDCDVLVVDRNNYHTFQPLLYQVAAAELESEQIASPVRGIFRGAGNVSFAMSEVCGLDHGHKLLLTDNGEIPYDRLVVAVGSVTNFFGVPGAETNAFRLKSLEQSIFLRNHIMDCFERAARSTEPAEQRNLLTFGVVGGGPTGVEFAGAMSELIRGPLAKDYPPLIAGQARVVLFEALQAILPGFPDHLREAALIALRDKGVQVFLGAQVAEVGEDSLRLTDGSNFLTRTVVWTAGVRAHPVAAAMNLPLAKSGRVLVDEFLRVRDMEDVLAIGDVCQIQGKTEDVKPLPMTAQVATQQGKHVARTILREMKGKKPKPFRFNDKGSMAAIGRNSAVVKLRRQSFTGFPAWLLWLAVHLLSLLGFRNRVQVLVNWAWDYFFFERAARIILPRPALWDRTGLDLGRVGGKDEGDASTAKAEAPKPDAAGRPPG